MRDAKARTLRDAQICGPVVSMTQNWGERAGLFASRQQLRITPRFSCVPQHCDLFTCCFVSLQHKMLTRHFATCRRGFVRLRRGRCCVGRACALNAVVLNITLNTGEVRATRRHAMHRTFRSIRQFAKTVAGRFCSSPTNEPDGC